MTQQDMVLVHGLYANADSGGSQDRDTVRKGRRHAFLEHAEALGIRSYDWIDGRGMTLANRMLQRARGTARAVDAVELITLDEQSLRSSLASESGSTLWRDIAGCDSSGYDISRSFILMGRPRHLVEGPADGMRVLWFGNGLRDLSREEFVEHYTLRHGPLVAGNAKVIGLRRYRQVPAEQYELCEALREVGLGRAASPAVFAELVMGAPPFSPSMVLRRRAVNRDIKTDERRHIDFSRSMLLLTRSKGSEKSESKPQA